MVDLVGDDMRKGWCQFRQLLRDIEGVVDDDKNLWVDGLDCLSDFLYVDEFKGGVSR